MSNRLSPVATIFCAFAASLPAAAQDTEIRSCVITPSAVVELSMPVPGLVREMHVGRGDAVAAGDVLVELDDTAIAVEIAVAERRATDRTQLDGLAQRLAVLEGQRERMRDLSQRDLVARNDLDRLEDQLLALYQERDRLIAARDLAALDLQRVEAQMAQRVLRAPTGGVVTERHADPGEYATEQRPVLTVATLDPLHVELFAPLELRDRIAPGDTIAVTPEAGGAAGTELEATVEVVDRVFDAASGTFGVRLTLPNPGLALPAGLRCRATI